MGSIFDFLVRYKGESGEFAQVDKEVNATIEVTDKKSNKLGETMKNAFKLGGAALMAVGATAIKAGAEFDEGFKSIRAGTGATGEALREMKEDFRGLTKEVPDSVASVGKAMADVNTLTGATGEGLKDLTKTFLDLSRVTGEDVSATIASSTRLFGDWGIATENQTKKMDDLFKVSQTTGIGVGKLSDMLVSYGAPLRNLGYSIEESAALFGKWNKEGVNTEIIFGGMKQAIGKFAREGKNIPSAFREAIETIKNMESSSSATGLAMELFGAQAGPDMAAAIREGKFELEDLMKTLESSEETIGGAAKESRTFAESMGLLKNQAFAALQPLAETLFPIIIELMEKIAPYIDMFGEELGGLLEELVPSISTIIEEMMPMVDTILPIIMEGIKSILPIVVKLVENLFPPIVKIMDKLLPFVMDSLNALMPVLDVLVESILPLFTEILEAFMPILEPILDLLNMLLKELLVPMLTWVIEKGLGPIIAKITIFFEWLGPFVEKIGEWISKVTEWLSGLLGGVTETVEGSEEKANGFFTRIGDKLGEWVTKAIEILGSIGEFFSGLWDGIVTCASTAIDSVKDFIMGIWNKVVEVVAGIKKDFCGTFQEIWKSVTKTIDDIKKWIGGISDKVVQVKDDIIKQIGTWAGDMVTKGKEMMDGLIQGMIDGVKGLWGKIKEVGGVVVKFFEKVFGIASPSKLIAERIGHPITMAIIEPVSKIGDLVKDALVGGKKKLKEDLRDYGKEVVGSLGEGVTDAAGKIEKEVERLVKIVQKIPDKRLLEEKEKKADNFEIVGGDYKAGIIGGGEANKLYLEAHVSEEFEDDLIKLSKVSHDMFKGRQEEERTFEENVIYYFEEIVANLGGLGREIGKEIKKQFDSLMEWVEEFGEKIIESTENIVEKIVKVIVAIDTLKMQYRISFENLIKKIGEFQEELIEELQELFSGVYKSIADAVENINKEIKNAALEISSTINKVAGDIIKYLSKITQLLERLLDDLKMAFKMLQDLKNQLLGGNVKGSVLPGDGSVVPPPTIIIPDPWHKDPRDNTKGGYSGKVDNSIYINSQYNVVKKDNLFTTNGDLALMGYKI